MLLAGRGVRVTIDEAQAMGAVNHIAEQYPYIDFNQIFPDTYRFQLSCGQAWNRTIRVLRQHGEYIMEKDRRKGLIYTAAKEAVNSKKEKELQDKIFYQYSIFLTCKSPGVTYITVYPTVLKGQFREVLSPLVRNTMRGVFFGGFSEGLYPREKGVAMTIYRERQKKKKGRASKKNSPQQKAGDKTHTVQAGETLGIIARKYTGKSSNYRRLMQINGITDAASLQVGQKLRIPAALLK